MAELSPLRPLADDLFVAERPLRFQGLEIGTRMTVARLPGDALWLHSPVRPDPELRKAVDALGAVRFLVAPNRFHHLFVKEWGDAEIYVAPGLPKKRPDLAHAHVLADEAPPAWKGALDQHFFRGFPLANEVAFLHRASRTLVLSDLAFQIGPEAPLLTRLAFRALAAYDRFGPSLAERLLIRDRAAARRSLETILAWDFDRVVVAHGRILESGGREALRRGYGWLLGGAGR